MKSSETHLVPSPRADDPTSGLDEHRRLAIARLSEAFENDLIELDELETKLARVKAASELAEMDAELAGLETAPAEAPAHPRVLARAQVPGSKIQLAFMSGVERKGAWVVPRHLRAIAVMGGIELDLREARLGPGITSIWALAFMGGVEITVPPDVRVECSGLGILGGFEDRTQTEMDLSPDTPVIRISGLALMGGVEISTRFPGESKRAARKRLKRGSRPRPLPSGRDRD